MSYSFLPLFACQHEKVPARVPQASGVSATGVRKSAFKFNAGLHVGYAREALN